MKIVIVGAGFTGTQLAKRLINGKNDVVLIDNDEDVVRHASNRLDCNVIQADGNNLDTLEEAGIETADALVCVTSNDEVNMITCSLVDSVYPKILKIARVRNYAYYANTSTAIQKHASKLSSENRHLYGIDYMIHPDVEAAEAIVAAVEHGAITDSLQFENSSYELIRVTIENESRLDGIALQNMRKLTEKHFLVCYIESDGETSLPSGATILHGGDCLGVLMNRDDLPEMLNLCGSKLKDVKKIALVGANRIGTIVAERLIKKESSSKFKKFFGFKSRISQEFVIVDSNEANAKAASEKFPGTRVFCADVTEEGFVEEEGIDKFDLVICATSNYELNMVMAAYIESLGVENSIALVANAAFGEVARKIGIEVAVPIRDSVIDSIMSHLRGDSVTGIHSVNGGSLEIAEIIVPKESEIKGKALKDIAENGKFLVMQVQKKGDENYSIPGGNTVLDEGDKIVLIINAAENEHVMKKFAMNEL
ncbi:NAD-binding protein [Treponema sp.]|uniref:NAD-binding protein n=1 Tax=Treponema sp. TaxID=166 RepID=UPI00388E1C99